MSNLSLVDVMYGYYLTALGRTVSQGTVIDCERAYFIASLGSTYNDKSWADCASAFYASMNASVTPGSLYDEAFKYYSSISGLTPATTYSLTDHIRQVFDINGGPSSVPPITDNLEAYYDARYPDGFINDGRISKNLINVNQATAEIDTSGWGGSSSPTITRVTAALGQQGNACIQASIAAGGTLDVGMGSGTISLFAAVVPGQTYTAYAECQAATTLRSCFVHIDWRDAAGTYMSTTNGSASNNAVGSWTKYLASGVAPVGAYYAIVRVSILSTGAGENHYFDKLGIWAGTSTDWVPPGKLWSPNKLTYNQATVETDTTGFGINLNCTIARDTSQYAQGVASLAATSVGAGNMQFLSGSQNNRVPVTAGSTYTALVVSKAATVARSVFVELFWFNAQTSGFISSSPGVGINNSTGVWTQHSVTAIAPVGATYAAAYVTVTGAAGAGEIHYVDQFDISEGAQIVWQPPYRGPNSFTDGQQLDSWTDISGKGRTALQLTPAKYPKFRKANPNILSYNQATVEAGTAGFAAGTNNPTLAKSNTFALDGLNSLSVTATAAADMAVRTTQIAVVGGQQYTALASCRSAITSRTSRVLIQWLTVGLGFISNSQGSNISSIAGAWTPCSVTATAPANAAFCYVIVEFVSTPALAEVHYIDCLSLALGSSTAWVPPANSLVTAGKMAMQFDGADDVVQASNIPIFASTTVYVVAEHMASDGVNSLRTVSIAGGAGAHDQFCSNTGKYGGKLGAAYFPGTTINAVGNGCHICATTYDGAAGQLELDNANFLTGAAASALGTALVIGSAGATNYSYSAIHAVLVFSAVHSAPQRQSIVRWLGSLFGITVA